MPERNPERLLSVVRRIRQNPYTETEIDQMRRELEALEAAVPELVERAAQERADAGGAETTPTQLARNSSLFIFFRRF